MKKAPEDIVQEANYGFSLGFVEASFLEVAVVGVAVGFVWIFKHDVNYGFDLSFFEAGGIEDTSGFLDSVLSVPELVEAGRRPISLVSVGAQAQGSSVDASAEPLRALSGGDGPLRYRWERWTSGFPE